MTWTRIGDDFTDQPALLEVSRSARLLHVEALVYCNKHLLDGHLPVGALRRITDAEEPDLDAKHLVNAGVWQESESSWRIDWTGQEKAAEVRARQEYRAGVQGRYRDRKARHSRGDHSMCDGRFCTSVTGHPSSNENSDESSDKGGDEGGHEPRPHPSLPDPSLPVPKGQGQVQGQGKRTGSAGAPPTAPAGEEDKPAWPALCGQCEDRFIEREDGTYAYCPRCHPKHSPSGDRSA